MSKNVRIIVFSAACIALACVTSMIKVFEFPTGGAITLCSMLFAALPGFFFGPVVGIISGIVYGVLQFILGPYVLTPVQVLLDYPLAFGAAGIAGFWHSQPHGLLKGYLAGCAGRWFFSFLSGWIFFGEYAWEGWNGAAYSAVYNIIYIGAEAIITVIIISIPAVAKAISRVKQTALGGDAAQPRSAAQ